MENDLSNLEIVIYGAGAVGAKIKLKESINLHSNKNSKDMVDLLYFYVLRIF